MVAVIPIIALIVIGGVVGTLVYQGQSNTVVSGISSAFDTFTSGSPEEGFEIIHKTTKKPQSEKTVTNQSTNSTTVILNDVYQKDEIITYSVTNIEPIQGYIILYDSQQKPIKPYSYDFRISLSCSDLVEGFAYCNLDPTSNRGTTTHAGQDDNGNDLGGHYYWDWQKWKTIEQILPSNVDEVIYDVTVFVDANGSDGSWVTEQSSYMIRIVP